MPFFRWSQTSNANATADPTINWQEGQSPSSINDSARAMMAASAQFRDDIAGAIVTTGTSTAYLVSSYQQFDSLAHLDGQMIAFTPHLTNGGGATLNVDSLGARGIVFSSGNVIPAGTLIANTPYLAVYNNASTEFRLHGFYGNPYNIPLGATLDYWLPTAPNSSFVFPFGQAISRTTYASLFGLMGTTYGAGDGSSTFNLPDLRGRVVASPDIMGGSDAGRLSNAVSNIATFRNTLGGAGGEVAHTLGAAELPTITFSGSGSVSGSTTQNNILFSDQVAILTSVGGSNPVKLFNQFANQNVGSSGITGTASVSGTSNNTGSLAHNVVQPTILGNRIMRVA